jgi:AcrR family transcriptional regulator
VARSAAAILASETAVPDRFQRPERQHALDLARNMFIRGERLEMGELCAALGIGRTTLYRWVGDREQLLGEVLGQLVDDGWDLVIEQATGRGRERVLDATRRFMELTASFEPLRQFVDREPQLALRVLLSPNGVVQQRIREGSIRSVRRNWPESGEPRAELIDVTVQVATALEWAPIAIGEPPEIDRAITLIRSLIQTEVHARRYGEELRLQRARQDPAKR